MQPRRWCGQRARVLSEDSLITLVVREVAFAADVRRQRHRSVRIKIDIFGQPDDPFAVRQNFFDAQQHVVDLSRGTGSHLATGLDQTFPARGAEFLQKQKLDRVIVRKSARRQNPGVVQDQQVARLQEGF